MICGNTSDFMNHPLSKYLVSAHGVSHHAWAPGPPPFESGADKNTNTLEEHHIVCEKISKLLMIRRSAAIR